MGLELELGGVGLRPARGIACEEVARVVLRAFVVPFPLNSGLGVSIQGVYRGGGVTQGSLRVNQK